VTKVVPQYKLRGLSDGDWTYILDSWKRSARHWRGGQEVNGAYVWVPASIYYREVERVADALRAKGSWVVACDTDDEDFIVGWGACGLGALWYVYTRNVARTAGVAKAIVESMNLSTPLLCPMWTGVAELFAKDKPGRVVYAPSKIGELLNERPSRISKADVERPRVSVEYVGARLAPRQ
jgi:hypothetical protein